MTKIRTVGDVRREKQLDDAKRFIGTIDLTPTWSEILPTLLTVYRDATPAGQEVALTELRRMAALADLHVARLKES
jgi:hypothetical protein